MASCSGALDGLARSSQIRSPVWYPAATSLIHRRQPLVHGAHARDVILVDANRDRALVDMRFVALAIDYDGTLATDERVHRSTIRALKRARRAGVRLIVMTGSTVPEFVHAFSDPTLFDRVVAENGAVLYAPARGRARTLGASPPPVLLERLKRHSIPVSVGRVVISTQKAHERALTTALDELQLDWQIISNRETLMILPTPVTKATGLLAALAELGIAATAAIAVGDAENDEPCLEEAGLGVAVANALPRVKAVANIVTTGREGDGVREVIDRLLSGSLEDVPPHTGGRLAEKRTDFGPWQGKSNGQSVTLSSPQRVRLRRLLATSLHGSLPAYAAVVGGMLLGLVVPWLTRQVRDRRRGAAHRR